MQSLAVLVFAGLAVAGSLPSHFKRAPQPFGFFVNNTIYQPTVNQSVTYPRFVELENGRLLATTSFSGPRPPYFPVFESLDGGATWTHISNITG
jgi:hypothetical protein